MRPQQFGRSAHRTRPNKWTEENPARQISTFNDSSRRYSPSPLRPRPSAAVAGGIKSTTFSARLLQASLEGRAGGGDAEFAPQREAVKESPDDLHFATGHLSCLLPVLETNTVVVAVVTTREQVSEHLCTTCMQARAVR